MNSKEEEEEIAAIYLFYLNSIFDIKVILDSVNLKPQFWQCKDCNCVYTPQKRNDRCNACGLVYSKGNFCYYCDCTYRISYEKNLIKCIKCGKCVHIECEKKFHKGNIIYNNQYCCPNCLS